MSYWSKGRTTTRRSTIFMSKTTMVVGEGGGVNIGWEGRGVPTGSIPGDPDADGKPKHSSISSTPKKPRIRVWDLSWFLIGSAICGSQMQADGKRPQSPAQFCHPRSQTSRKVDNKQGFEEVVWVCTRITHNFLPQADSNLTHIQQCKHRLHLTQNSGMGLPTYWSSKTWGRNKLPKGELGF